MKRNYAHQLLNEASTMNPGKWIKHSENVAKAASKIANRCELDEEKAYTLGLLHDIGRRFGIVTIRHGLDGFEFMRDLGYEEHARICLTHSYTIKNIDVYKGIGDYIDNEREYVKSILEKIEYTEYDRLIQLCDTLATAEGICTIETRLCDIINRAGLKTEMFKNNIFEKFKLKQYFENKYDFDLYKILSDNKLSNLQFYKHN